MIYIEPWNLIYYPIPKCACTSIKRCICNSINIEINYEDQVNEKNFLDPMKEIIYCKYKKIEYLNKDPNINFKSFVIVRNPIERIISCYINKVINKKKGLQKKYYNVKNFEDFVAICVGNEFPNIHINPMCDFIKNKKIDFVLKIENINLEWRLMFEKLNMKPPALPHHNKSDRNKYKIFISKKTNQLICDFYKKDFEIFKYKKNPLFL